MNISQMGYLYERYDLLLSASIQTVYINARPKSVLKSNTLSMMPKSHCPESTAEHIQM